MKVFLAAVVLVAFCVAIMCIGVFFHRDFPSSDVDDNPELLKRGISCYRHEDERLQNEGKAGPGAKCSGEYSGACEGCSFYGLQKKKN